MKNIQPPSPVFSASTKSVMLTVTSLPATLAANVALYNSIENVPVVPILAAILMATHDMNMVEKYPGRIVKVEESELIEVKKL